MATDTLNSLGFAKPPEQTRIVAAMSGGVDSSVVAALLKAQGYQVIGITMQLYDHGKAINKKGACCAGQDIHDAKRLAMHLDIPHYVVNYESRFHDQVMEDFADSYIAGSTPIPCIRCNQTVKFTDLLHAAKELDADALATGHYVERYEGKAGPELHRAIDDSRDQSYFLFATTVEQLDYLRFPIGHMPKSDVRTLAEQYGLSVANKPDSQDICFVPNGNYADIVKRLRPGAGRAGKIVDMQGNVLGDHEGVIHFTIGQRRGLGIATGEPLYVVKIDAPTRTVTVGPKEALMTRALEMDEINWLGEGSYWEACQSNMPVYAKVRSTRPPVLARLVIEAEHPVILFDKPEEAVACGQACVLYEAGRQKRVLGGGFITSTMAAA